MRTAVAVFFGCFLVGCNTEFSIEPLGKIPRVAYGDGVILIATDPYPLVKVGHAEYTEAAVRSSTPDTSLLRIFTNAYRGKYTDSLKASFVSWIGRATESQGGTLTEVQKCLEATGQLSAGVISLPMKAERARYEGKDSWLFQFVWGLSLDDLGHYRVYVLDASTTYTLLFITCR